jgi:hypothetical protein
MSTPAKFVGAPFILTGTFGSLSPKPTLPALFTRILSDPLVSTVNVSAAGNLIAVFASPV